MPRVQPGLKWVEKSVDSINTKKRSLTEIPFELPGFRVRVFGVSLLLMRLQINQEWIFIFCSFFLKLDFVAPLRLIGFQFAVEFSIVDVVSLVKTALSLNQTRYR